MALALSPALLRALRSRRRRQRWRRFWRRPFELLFGWGTAPDVAGAASASSPGVARAQAEVEREHDSFLLHPGMRCLAFLTADGRVLLDGRTWDGEPLREASGREVFSALAAGARTTGLAELLSLIPARPANIPPCAGCEGARWQRGIVCPECSGAGWLA